MRIAVLIFLSIFTFGSTPAKACPLDIACQPEFWDRIDTLEECGARKNYCLGINACWADFWRTAAYEYRDRVIRPGYERCVEKNSQ